MRHVALTQFVVVVPLMAACAFGQTGSQQPRTDFRFSFGPGQAVSGYIQVAADAMYSRDRGYGFEPFTAVPVPHAGAAAAEAPPSIQGVERTAPRPLHSHFVTSDRPFFFSVAVPPGNYQVVLVLGDMDGESTTTVKAESRMLILERVHTRTGQFATKSIIVNVRNSNITNKDKLKLSPGEVGGLPWDDKLTLEFCNSRPVLCAMEVRKVNNAVTVFLCGDAAVSSQADEPYGAWGQMLPRWFDDRVAVGDYAAPGETLKGFKNERRWAKVLSEVKPGDYVFLQFGGYDLVKTGRNPAWPADDPAGDYSLTYSEAGADYKRLLMECAAEVKKKNAVPVIVTPIAKLQTSTGAIDLAALGDYHKAAAEAAQEAGAAFIDLTLMSAQVIKALGPVAARQVFVDGQNTTSYGAYLFSRCVVEGIRRCKLELANGIVFDAENFDLAHPKPLPADFRLPLESKTGLPLPSINRSLPARGPAAEKTPFDRRRVGD